VNLVAQFISTLFSQSVIAVRCSALSFSPDMTLTDHGFTLVGWHFTLDNQTSTDFPLPSIVFSSTVLAAT